MIINFNDLTITEDENEDKILFEGSNGDFSSVSYFSAPRTLLVFNKEYASIYSSFYYTSNGVKKHWISQSSTTPMQLNAIDDLINLPTEGSDICIDMQALDWLGDIMKRARHSHTKNKFTTANIHEQDGTVVITYQYIEFINKVAKILSNKIAKYLNLQISVNEIINNTINVIRKIQVLWAIDSLSPDSHLVTRDHENDHRYMPYVLGNNLQENIDTFFKDSNIKKNKRLKKIILSKILKERISRTYIDAAVILQCEGIPPHLLGEHGAIKGTLPDGKVIWERKECRIRTAILAVIAWMHRCLPIDCVSDILDSMPNDKITRNGLVYGKSQNIVDFLNLFSLPKKKRIIKESIGQSQLLSDAAHQLQEYKTAESIPTKLKDKYKNGIMIPKFQTLKELHDKISVQYNEIQAAAQNAPIEYTMEEFKLHNAEKGDLRIALPSEGSVVVRWGQELKHCIASYIKRAAKKEQILLGVYIDGKLTYNARIGFVNLGQIEVPLKDVEKPTYTLFELRGHNNCNPDSKHKEIVVELLDEWMASVVDGRSEVSIAHK